MSLPPDLQLDSTGWWGGGSHSDSEALFRVEVPWRKKVSSPFQGNFSNHRGNINTLIPIKHLTSVCVQPCGGEGSMQGRREFAPERLRGAAFLMNLMKVEGVHVAVIGNLTLSEIQRRTERN